MSPPNLALTVILADEHHLFRAGLARLLKAYGIHTLAGSDSGQDTLQLVARNSPQVVIVSLTLADQSGLEVIHALRKLYANLPLLALSPGSSQLTRASALRAGANAVISKNHKLEQLALTIQRLAEQLRPGLHRRRQEKFISLRQLRILKALTSGHTNDQIAQNLNFSRSTIKAELRLLFDTFATQDRGQLISQAAHHGLISSVSSSSLTVTSRPR